MNNRSFVLSAQRRPRCLLATRFALILGLTAMPASEANAQRSRAAPSNAGPKKVRERPRRRAPSPAARRKLEAQAEAAAQRSREDDELATRADAAHAEMVARSEAARAENAAADQAILDDKEERRDELVLLPNASYSPETALLLGGYVAYLRHFGDPDETRPSTFELTAAGTTKSQFFAELGASLWLHRDSINPRLGIYAETFPNTYYGIGRGTTPDQAEGYTSRDIGAEAAALFRLVGPFYVGGRGSVDFREIVDREPNRELAANTTIGSRGGTTAALGPAVALDTRDNIYQTRTGTYLDVGYELAMPAIGSDFRMGRFKLDARQFIPIRKMVLAFQLSTEAASGNVPFYLLPSMGGDALRGIFTGRFRDKVLVQAQTELRFPIVWRFSGTAFIGAGHVGRNVGDFEIAGIVPAGGAGLRYMLVPDERVNIRLDVAYAAEGLLYYLNIGEAF